MECQVSENSRRMRTSAFFVCRQITLKPQLPLLSEGQDITSLTYLGYHKQHVFIPGTGSVHNSPSITCHVMISGKPGSLFCALISDSQHCLFSLSLPALLTTHYMLYTHVSLFSIQNPKAISPSILRCGFHFSCLDREVFILFLMPNTSHTFTHYDLSSTGYGLELLYYGKHDNYSLYLHDSCYL